MKEYKIYLLRCKSTNKCYIGVTSMPPKNRWSNGKGYRNQPVIYDDICKYGWKDFEHEIIDTATSYKESREKEKEYIDSFNTAFPNGYNTVMGETGVPKILRKTSIVKVDCDGNIVREFANIKQLKELYTKNQIRTIRECLFDVQDDLRPRFYDGGYWVLADIFNDAVKNIAITANARKGGCHSGLPKRVCQFDSHGDTVCIYSSQREAARNVSGARKTSMQSAISSNKLYLGFYWEYIE